jgi:hypothetical protein
VLVSLWGLPSADAPSPSHAGAVSSDEVLGILPDLSALKCEASPACAQQQASTVRAAMNLAHFNPTVGAYWHKWNNSASVQPPLYRRALRECRRPLCGGAWLCAGAGLARCRRCPLRPSPLSSRFWEFAEPVKEPLWEARKKKWIVITSIAPPTEDIRAWTKLGDWAIVVVSEGSAPAGSVCPRICTSSDRGGRLPARQGRGLPHPNPPHPPPHAVARSAQVGDDKSPPKWEMDGVTFLSMADQHRLPFKVPQLMPHRAYARKAVGYLYAMWHGAEAIFETDDDNAPKPGKRPVPAPSCSLPERHPDSWNCAKRASQRLPRGADPDGDAPGSAVLCAAVQAWA